MDPKVQVVDDSKPMLDTQLSRVQGVLGVEWAVLLYKGNQAVRQLVIEGMHHGEFQKGNIEDMVWAIIGTAIVNVKNKFAYPSPQPSPARGEGTLFISPPLRGGDAGEGELCQFI